MDDAEGGLIIGSMSVAHGIFGDSLRAYKDLTVLESDDIRRSGIAEELAVNSSDLPVADDGGIDFGERGEWRIGKTQRGETSRASPKGDGPNGGEVKADRSLAVADGEGKRHGRVV